ncbi:hypothetical protein BDN67DRAFT_1016335 [Paxillus ammoniavirescens]|nr:hypothetical protein BDN67DRAFT_1016335 [Paxillus ammoniavirescens]
MPGRAKSNAQKRVEAHNNHDKLMAQAVEAYRAEQAKPLGVPHHGLRKICYDFKQIHLQAAGKVINLSYSTLAHLATGKRSLAEASNEKSWLTTVETDQVIVYAKELADSAFHSVTGGFPNMLMKSVVQGSEMDFQELGNSGLTALWSSTQIVSKSHGPVPLIQNVVSIPPHTRHGLTFFIFAANEIDILPDSGDCKQVIGGRKPGSQYQQCTGNQENITIIVTICADGSAEPPAVILKGNAYQVKWKQDNPVNASSVYE